MGRLLLGVDTETTGVGADDAIVQVAVILLDPTTLETVDSFCTLVDPQREMSAEAQAVHGIRPEMLVGQPTMEDVWRDSPLDEWFRDSFYLFGHNVSFDIRMLRTELTKQMQVIDSMHLSRHFFPGTGSHKLTSCVEHLGLPARKAHDALGDVESSADVLRWLFHNKGWRPGDYVPTAKDKVRKFLDR